MSRSSTRQENRISPPSASNLRLRVLTTSGSRFEPEMRPVFVDDRRLAVAVGEDLQHVGDVGARAARGELAVAEGAGAPLAEEVVALGIERARTDRSGGRRRPGP